MELHRHLIDRWQETFFMETIGGMTKNVTAISFLGLLRKEKIKSLPCFIVEQEISKVSVEARRERESAGYLNVFRLLSLLLLCALPGPVLTFQP